jgi:hypothetical protein
MLRPAHSFVLGIRASLLVRRIHPKIGLGPDCVALWG